MAHISITADESQPQPEKQNFDKFLKTARERFKLCDDAESEIRREALDDLNFRAGQQWPQQIEADRKLSQRPCLTINRLPQFIKQVVNEQRQNRPSIQINPVGDGADQDTAEILQGLTRHIEINSNADVAYDTAFDHAATHGFGYFRVITEYQDDKSFDQEILFKRIINPFTVYFDPTCNEPDYSDARFAFIVEDFTESEFKEQYPGSDTAGLSDFSSVGDNISAWIGPGHIRVAEYFWIENETKTLVVLQDGSTTFKESLPDNGAGIAFQNSRTVEVQTVNWAKITAKEILEQTVWPGKWIPIVPVLGDEMIVDGKRQLVGIVRFAKDPQRMYNYMRSAITEMIALAPKAPFIVAEGQIEGFEEQWAQANNRNFATLTYKAKGLNGQTLPPPQRNTWEPPIQAVTIALGQSENDLKGTTGIYDASLGERGPEQSGKAILARQKQGDTANFNLIDNLSRSIKHGGRIVLDLIPHIYDAQRTIQIVKPDATHDMVQIAPGAPIEQSPGVEQIYDLTKGKYSVTVSVGPSYQSRRQEAVTSMLEFIKADPAVLQVAGDLLVGNMDWPGATEIAARLKKMLPPALQDDDKDPVPPQAQAKIAQLTQQLQVTQQGLQQATQMLSTKVLELESKERMASEANQTAMIVADLKTGSEQALAMMQQEFQAIHKRLEMLHESEPIGMEAAPHGQPISAVPEPVVAAPAKPKKAA